MIGDKTNYKGANYLRGQPFIVEGDPKLDLELHRKASSSIKVGGGKDEPCLANRHRDEVAEKEWNDGAHFDFCDVIQDIFALEEELHGTKRKKTKASPDAISKGE